MPRISWHSQFWTPDQIWSHLIKECPGELASPSLHLPPAPGYYTALYTRLNFSINEIGLSDIGDIYIFRFVCFCLVFACLKCFDKSPKAEFKEKMQVFSEQNAEEKHEEWWRNDGVFSSRKIQFFLLAQKVWKSWSRARFCGISSCCFTYFIFLSKGGGGSEGTLYNLVQRLRVMTILKRFFWCRCSPGISGKNKAGGNVFNFSNSSLVKVMYKEQG